MLKNKKTISKSLGKESAGQLEHIAIIMDGNGRWAKKRGLPREIGHKKGANSLISICRACIKQSIPYITVYAFSTENWQRSEHEVQSLMSLMKYYMNKEVDNLLKEGIKIRVIGDKNYLEQDVIKKINEVENITQHNTKLTANIALSYGSRQEIVNAAKLSAKYVIENNIDYHDIDDDLFSRFLYSNDIPAYFNRTCPLPFTIFPIRHTASP
ncbi:MAG: polyprenyl diphosphate synthase, partial [Pseudomonadota bacterium]